MCKQTDTIPDEAKGSKIVFPDLTQLGSALWTDEWDCETPPPQTLRTQGEHPG